MTQTSDTRRAWLDANRGRRNAQQARRRAADRAKIRAQAQARYAADPGKEQERNRQWHAANPRPGWWPDGRRHPTPEQWLALYTEQAGRCYLCGEPIPNDRTLVALDHDHRCCPRHRSCPRCRRGLAHPVCNSIAGLARDNPDRLRLIAANLDTARARVTAALDAEPALFTAAEIPAPPRIPEAPALAPPPPPGEGRPLPHPEAEATHPTPPG